MLLSINMASSIVAPLSFCDVNTIERFTENIIDRINENDLIVFVAPNDDNICMSNSLFHSFWKNMNNKQGMDENNENVVNIATILVKNNPHVTVWKVCPTGIIEVLGNLFYTC